MPPQTLYAVSCVLASTMVVLAASHCLAQGSHGPAYSACDVEPLRNEGCLESSDCGSICAGGDVTYLSRISFETLPKFVVEQPSPGYCSSGPYASDQRLRSEFVVASTYVTKKSASEDLLPAPNDGNDLFYSQLDYSTERLPDGDQPLVYSYFLGADGALKDLVTRFKGLPSFGFFFDTGFVGTDFDVSKIALGNSPQAGQTTFVGSGDLTPVPLSVLLDNQILDSAYLGDNQLQVYLETNNHGNGRDWRLPHLYSRLFNLDRITVGAGKTYSLFGVGGALPSTISQASSLIGTGELDDRDKVKQIRLQVNPDPGGWGWGFAVEEAFSGDFTQFTGTKLTRWPNFAGNLVFKGADGVDRLQFSSLLRTLGFEAGTGEEFFETAWAFSSYAMVGSTLSEEQLQGFFAGIAGGDGVGGYVQGLDHAAVFNGSEMRLVEGIGAYVGAKRQWKTSSSKDVGVNLAYGYASIEREAGLDAAANRKLQQAWANLLYFPSQNVAVGVEYLYGRRQTIGNDGGEDHRILFMLALTTSAGDQERSSYLKDTDWNRNAPRNNRGASQQRL